MSRAERNMLPYSSYRRFAAAATAVVGRLIRQTIAYIHQMWSTLAENKIHWESETQLFLSQ